MSIIIGYWSEGSNAQTSAELRRLLIRSVSGLSSSEVRISAPFPQSSTAIFGIAVHGRHARVHDEAQSLSACLSVAGAGFEPDVWTRLSSNALVLGRNVFGRAPLFWTGTNRAVWFSNRLEFLLRVVKDAKLSVDGFYAYSCFSFVPAPQTPIENVFAVRAGTEITWKAIHAAPEVHNLHEWREASEQRKNEYLEADRLRRLLEESVEAQLADYKGEPVGVFLSGGLDSSLTAALLARAGVKLKAYTLDLRADCFTETAYAELVARTLKIPLTKVPVTAGCMRRALPSTARRLDGLYGDGVTVPLALMYQRASKEVKTIFNGEGGDQLFAGWTNKPLIAASIYEDLSLQPGRDAFTDVYMRTFHRFHGHETGVYSKAIMREIDSTACIAPVVQALDPSYSRTLLHRLRRANLLLKGADNIQPRAANLGLSYNLDVRTLFCSLPLAEWTFGVSGDLWLHAGCEKYLLKRAVEDILPSEIVWREKRGMGIPLTIWLTGPLRRWCQRQLHPRHAGKEGLWEADLANRISSGELSGHIQGRRIGETLWLMLMWRAWRERNLEEVSTTRGSGWVRSRAATVSNPDLGLLKRT